jgi:beta-galactosidase
MNYWNSPETTSINREPILNLNHEESLSLDGVWDFQLLKSPTLEPGKKWANIPVPGLWTMQTLSEVFWDKPIYTNVQMPFDELPPAVPALNPTGIYERDFEIPKSWKGTRFLIQIGGFESVAILSINGVEVGMAKDSRLAADFDITSYLKTGRNRIQIKVVKWSDATYIEDQDQWWHGGITRSIKLYATPSVYLQRFYATPGLMEDLKTGTLKIRGYLASADGSYPSEYSVEVSLQGAKSKKISSSIPPKAKPESILEEFAGWLPEYKAMWSSEYWDNNLPPVLAKSSAQYRPTQLSEIEMEGRYSILPWSPESPTLYTLLIEVKNPQGQVTQRFTLQTGFRDTRVVGHTYLFNYKPVIIYGINRHDFNPETGRVLNREYMRKDLLALKAFNFNAIRTAHYPNDPALLEIADELGFYVIGEANIESHAFQDSICHDSRYLTAFVDRIGRMAQRDISHPSVIFWSLGNEAGTGPNHSAAAAYLRNFDPSRPLHYEGAIRITRFQSGYDQSDVICPMYPSIKAIVSYAKSPLKNRPLIMCEYSHAMGNSNGTLAEYWEAIHKYDGLQGGFIWEFWDHALNQELSDGTTRSAYGGDFGEERHDGSFVCDGMFWSDRRPKPAMYEMRTIAAPLSISKKNLEELTFEVWNKHFFIDSGAYSLHWEVTVEGLAIDSGVIPIGKIAPQMKKSIKVTSRKAMQSKERGERFINFAILQKDPTEWLPANAEIGHVQFALKSSRKFARKVSTQKVSAVDGFGNILLPYGVVAPKLTLFRAPTENDTYGNIAPQWRAWGLAKLTQSKLKVSQNSRASTISRLWLTSAGIEVKQIQTLTSVEGGFSISEKIIIPKVLTDLPRIGITFELDNSLENYTYFGSGPAETYPDRALSPITLSMSTVQDQYIPYVVPQESGGHHGVRWFELSDNRSKKFRIELDKPRQVSVLPYTREELTKKSHDVELSKSGTTVVTIDAIHRGIGTASCGPDTLDKYLIRPGTYNFTWTVITR